MPYRSMAQLCPDCSEALRELKCSGNNFGLCPRCKGVWVPQNTLEKLFSQSAAGTGGTPHSRLCTICKSTTTQIQIDGIQVERCEQHGVWFETDELTRAVYSMKRPRDLPRSPSIAILRELLERIGKL